MSNILKHNLSVSQRSAAVGGTVAVIVVAGAVASKLRNRKSKRGKKNK